MMKMGCFLMNEARIIRSLPSTDIGRGCVVLEYHVVGSVGNSAVGNSAVPLSSAALKQPASPEGGFRLAKRTPDGGLGRTYSRSSLCNDPLHGIDSPWRTRAIGEAQEQGYTHLRATCPKCGRIADVPWPLLLGRRARTGTPYSATFPCGANGAGTRRRLLACVNSALPES